MRFASDGSLGNAYRRDFDEALRKFEDADGAAALSDSKHRLLGGECKTAKRAVFGDLRAVALRCSGARLRRLEGAARSLPRRGGVGQPSASAREGVCVC